MRLIFVTIRDNIFSFWFVNTAKMQNAKNAFSPNIHAVVMRFSRKYANH